MLVVVRIEWGLMIVKKKAREKRKVFWGFKKRKKLVCRERGMEGGGEK